MVAVLAACSGGTDAMVRTLQQVVRRDGGIAGVQLNSNFRYLRITVAGRVALMVLGSVDSLPQGAVEVWYSSQREVLRFQNGRTVGAVGLTTEWREVGLPALPSWSELARTGQPFRWSRVRDVMPGYSFGVIDSLVLRVISPPRKTEMLGVDPQGLTWFEEQVEPGERVGGLMATGMAGVDKLLPPARYAVDFRGGKETVVYGEQCLAADLCFTWQRWPVVVDGSAGKG